MPVTATPVSPTTDCPTSPTTLPASRTPVPVDCMGVQVIVPAEPTDPVTGNLLLSRTRAVSLTQGIASSVRHVMRNPAGQPIDLSGCLCNSSSSSSDSVSSSSGSCPCEYQLYFRMGEQMSGYGDAITATVVDAENGVVQVELTADDTVYPGIYFGEFGLEECSTQQTVFSNVMYIVIGSNIMQQCQCGSLSGPPTIAQLRMLLRDTDPAESALLTTLAYSDEEIANALTLPVMYWNEIPPEIGTYTTQTFPYRYHWMIGAIGHLYRAAAEKMRRNNLQFQTSGVTVRDQDKESNYERAGEARLTEFYNFVRRKKSEINLMSGFGGIGGYGY